jgi:hypothetical protein
MLLESEIEAAKRHGGAGLERTSVCFQHPCGRAFVRAPAARGFGSSGGRLAQGYAAQAPQPQVASGRQVEYEVRGTPALGLLRLQQNR